MSKSDLSGNEWTLEQNRRFLAEQQRRRQMAWGGGGGDSTFSPLSLSPIAWWDPSDLSTLFQDAAMTTPVTTDGQPVGAMRDKAGNNHLTQSTAGSRLIYKTAGGLRWLESDGVNDFLSVTYGVNLAQPWEAVSAIRRLAATDDVYFFGGVAGNVGAVNVQGGLLRILSGGALNGPACPANGVDFISIEGHNGNVSSRIAVDNGAFTVGDAGASAAIGLVVASTVSGTTNFAAMRFYGRVQFSRVLQAGEITQLLTYLGAKQGRVL